MKQALIIAVLILFLALIGFTVSATLDARKECRERGGIYDGKVGCLKREAFIE